MPIELAPESREALVAAIEKGDRDFAEGRYREIDHEGLRAYRDQLLERIARRET